MNQWPARVRQCLVHCSVLVLVVLSAACERETTARVLEVGSADWPQTEDSLAATIVSRQRRLHVLLASADESAAELIAMDVTFYDMSRPDEYSRDWRGRPARGGDYFRVLAAEFEPIFAELDSIQVMPLYAGSVTVVVTHSGNFSTLTRWAPRDSTWKVMSLTINAPDSTVADMYARFQAAVRENGGR